MNNPVWHDPKLLKLWMLCLLEASHKEHEQLVGRQIVKLEPGEFVTGRYALAEAYNSGMKKNEKVNERTLWRWMKTLEDGDFLTIKSTTKYSVISIKNWNLYQPSDQPVSNKRPANVHQVSTNNNGNNGNNGNKKDTTTTTENPVQLFEKLLCRLSPNQMAILYKWQDDFGGQADIVNEAITIADNKNKRYFGFVEYLLKEWSNNKLDSLDRVRAYEQEKFNKQTNVRPFARKGRSIFEQGEESKRRQGALKPQTSEQLERIKKMEEGLPY